jgi:hypothetical protein
MRLEIGLFLKECRLSAVRCSRPGRVILKVAISRPAHWLIGFSQVIATTTQTLAVSSATDHFGGGSDPVPTPTHINALSSHLRCSESRILERKEGKRECLPPPTEAERFYCSSASRLRKALWPQALPATPLAGTSPLHFLRASMDTPLPTYVPAVRGRNTMALYVSYGREADACWVSQRVERCC